tara:strand:- start:1201 stop:1596 length:396 start_codon:yes stop_codon:yes gene_type:complete
MVRYDEVGSISKKLKTFFLDLDVTNFLIVLVGVGVFALLMGAMNQSIVTAQSVVTAVITTVIVYVYFKKEYSRKIKKLKLKNKLLKKDSILDELCASKKTRNTKLCNNYETSKRSFYNISNMLLQRYNIND